MVQEIVLYEDVEGNKITAEVDDAYREMLSKLESESEADVKSDLSAVVETLIHQSIQSMPREGSQLNKAYAELIFSLQETEEINLDRLVENAIHTLNQRY